MKIALGTINFRSVIFMSSVEFYYNFFFQNHQVAPRYKGVEYTYLTRHQYRQSGNPIRSKTFLKLDVEFHNENSFGNHQIASRYKGQTNLMSY